MTQSNTLDNPTRCVHCGAPGPLSDDHIPPKNLYTAPRPSNLITVPACESCNAGAAKDDEYFRLALSMRREAEANPRAIDASTKSLRGLSRTESSGFRAQFLNDVVYAWQESEDSRLLIHDIVGYTAEFSRLDRVVKRLVTGFFFHNVGRRLPDSHSAHAWTLEGLHGTPGWEKAENILRILQSRPVIPVGIQDVFFYRYMLFDEDPNASLWLFVVFGSTGFIGLTMPRDRPSRPRIVLP